MLELLLPLVTSPLFSRRLGAEAFGTYTYSIVSLFVMYSKLGSYRYGMREIAKVQNTKADRDRVYSYIFWTHVVNAAISLLVYLAISFFIGYGISYERKDTCEQIKNAGYDIKEMAKKMENFFESELKKIEYDKYNYTSI